MSSFYNRKQESAGGAGDVTGPASSTDNAFVRFDGTTGKTIQNGQITESDTGDLANANSIGFDATPSSPPTTTEGVIYWDSDENAPTATTDVAAVNVHLGREIVIKARNTTGSTIAKGKVVYIDGASGGRPTIALADASVAVKADGTIGVTAEAINDNQNGYVVTTGYVSGIDTSSYTAGQRIYLSTTPGEFTATKPASPNHLVKMGHIVTAQVNGKVLVNVFTHFHADETTTDVTNFGRILSATDTDVQKALDTIDNEAVKGAASATDNAIARFDLTSGKIIQNSLSTIDDLGNLSTTSVGVNGTAGAGFITLVGQSSNPTAPAAGSLLIHASTVQGFTRMEQDNEAATNLIYGRDNAFIARNTSGSTINKGQVVYVTGSTGNVPNVSLAQANSVTTIPTIAVAVDSISNSAFGQIMYAGIISGIDTSAFTSGDKLYVSPTVAGGLTNVRPSGTTNYVQRVGTVLVSGVGNGSIQILIAPAVLNMETGTNAATWTGQAIVGTTGTFSAASSLTLGTASSAAGAIIFNNATNANTLTIQSGVTGATIAYTLPITAPTDGQVLSCTAAGVMSWATSSGFSWGATASGSSGVGLALTSSSGATGGYSMTVSNSSTAPTNAWNYSVLGNTQAVAHVMQKIDLGTSAQAHTGLLVNAFGASTSQRGVKIDCSTTGTGNHLELVGGVATGLGASIKVSSSASNQLPSNFIATANPSNISGTPNTRFLLWRTTQTSGTARSTPVFDVQVENILTTTGAPGHNTLDITRTETASGAGVTGTSSGSILKASISVGAVSSGVHNSTIGGLDFSFLQNGSSNWDGKFYTMSATWSSSTLSARTIDSSEILYSRTNTATTGTVADSFNLQYLKRTSIQNGAGGTFTAAGSVLKLENVATQTAGTLTDTVIPLLVVQDADSTGLPIKVTQNAVVSTNFRRVIGESVTGITIWISNGTDPNGALSGTAGDICLNGATNKPAYCTGTTNWTNLV